MSPLHFGFTEFFIVGVTLFIFAADLLLREFFGDGQTISDRFALWSMRYPIIAALLGILVGHLCWPNRGYCP